MHLDEHPPRQVKIWTNFFFLLRKSFPSKKQPKISVPNYFIHFPVMSHITTPVWTFCQWTFGLMHHRLRTSGRKGTVQAKNGEYVSLSLLWEIENRVDTVVGRKWKRNNNQNSCCVVHRINDDEYEMTLPSDLFYNFQQLLNWDVFWFFLVEHWIWIWILGFP